MIGLALFWCLNLMRWEIVFDYIVEDDFDRSYSLLRLKLRVASTEYFNFQEIQGNI